MVARTLALLLVLAPLVGCARLDVGAEGAGGPPAAQDGGPWTDLFDGATLDGWHGYARTDVPSAWAVEDGMITFTPGDDGGDIVAPGTWDDFELEVEWWIAECGNSGIFYRGEEDAALAPIWRTSLESQILDDTCHSDARYPSHRAGGLYDLYTPEVDAPARGGVWHTSRIVADGDRIEHWLDGTRVVTARQGSDDWNARVAASKFRDNEAFPDYGTRRTGLIGLQDHGDALRVRAVRVRTL